MSAIDHGNNEQLLELLTHRYTNKKKIDFESLDDLRDVYIQFKKIIAEVHRLQKDVLEIFADSFDEQQFFNIWKIGRPVLVKGIKHIKDSLSKEAILQFVNGDTQHALRRIFEDDSFALSKMTDGDIFIVSSYMWLSKPLNTIVSFKSEPLSSFGYSFCYSSRSISLSEISAIDSW